MAVGDVAAALALDARTPEVAHWSRSAYEQAISSGFHGWVAEADCDRRKTLAGFLVARRMGDEVEILNLAVDVWARRRGLGSSLLGAALEFGRASGVKRALLEVRESNTGAIAFYLRHGFAATGKRLRYYQQPTEDALVLSRQLSE